MLVLLIDEQKILYADCQRLSGITKNAPALQKPEDNKAVNVPECCKSLPAHNILPYVAPPETGGISKILNEVKDYKNIVATLINCFCVAPRQVAASRRS